MTTANDISSSFGLGAAIGKLFRLRWLLFVNGFRHARLRVKFGMFLAGLSLLFIFGIIYLISFRILDFFRSPRVIQLVGDTSVILSSVPVLILMSTFLGVLLTSFGILLQALYLAGDMDFLLSSPLPIRAIFVTKLLQAILPNFGLSALFGLPVLFGLGVTGHYNLIFYPLVVVILAALALTATGISALLVMWVAHLFPARRVAEVIGFIGAIISLICAQSNQFFRYDDINSQTQFIDAFNSITRFNTPWFPLAWGGRGLVDIGEGRWLSGIFFLSITLGLSGGLFWAALVTAERLYYSGWASIQNVGIRRKPTPAARMLIEQTRSRAPWVEKLIPTSIRGILTKDWLMLRRDLRQLSQLVTSLVLGILYALMLFRRSNTPAPSTVMEAPSWFMEGMKNAAIYLNVGVSLFVGWSLLSRLAGMGFSQEGKSYWIVKASPISSGRLIFAKYLVAYVPSLLVGWGFLLIISLVQGASLPVIIFGLAVIALSIAGTTGINLAFGVLGANFDWQDPRRMSSSGMGCLGAVLTLAYLIITLGLFFLPPVLFPLYYIPEQIGQTTGILLGGSLGLLCAFLPPMLVKRRA